MNGLHIPGTPLVVDCWRQKNVPPRALFFLTHLHADHTCGLTSNWPYPIHCTPLTARLLINKFKIRRDLVVELEVEESRLLHVVGLSEKVSVTVSVLDANHCPGSAMFLFEGYFGRILYTGDFRYSPTMSALPQLMQCRPVDLLYLDNTYCHMSCRFPPRERATDEIVNLIRSNKEGLTLLGLHTLGKEDLLVAIARRLGMWVGVSPQRYETLQLIEAENVFTTDTDSCFVRVLPFHIALRSGMRVSPEDGDSVLVVLPTCVFSGESAPSTPSHPSIKVVPYSDHSSFDELMEFVGVVKPRCVRPIVRSFSGKKSTIMSSRCNMSVFDHLLDPTPPTNYEVPKLISRLFDVGNHDDRPHPSSSGPFVRRSLEGRSHCRRRKRASGVSYISPSKGSHESHVTEAEREAGDCQVIEGAGKEEGLEKSEEENVNTINISTESSPTEAGQDTAIKPLPPRHTSLELRLGPRPKPVLPPVVRVLSEPRRAPVLRSGVFYGTEAPSRQVKGRKRSRSCDEDAVLATLDVGRRGRGRGRKVPLTVTRPVWVTRLEREWGVAMGGAREERGGGGGGGGTLSEGKRKGAIEGREVGGRDAGEERRSEEENRVPRKSNQMLIDECLANPSPSATVAWQQLHSQAVNFDLQDLNVTLRNETPPTRPVPFLPELPPLGEILNQATRSCDDHVTISEPNSEIIFDFIDKILLAKFP